MAIIIIKKLILKETHESPLIMLIPLIILAIGAIFAGFLFKDFLLVMVAKMIFGQIQLNF